MTKVVIGADHRGWQLKEALKVSGLNVISSIDWVDVGAFQEDTEDDYPDIAKLLIDKLRSDPQIKKGILVCGSGVGMCIVANKYPKIRCGLAINPHQVKDAREKDNINILAIAADYTSIDTAIVLVEVFLDTEFSRLPKYTRRIEKIIELEKTIQKIEQIDHSPTES